MSYFILMGRRIPKQAITGFKFQNETDNIRPFLSIRIRGKDEIIPFKDKKEIQSVKAHLCSIFSGFVKIGDWYLKMSEVKEYSYATARGCARRAAPLTTVIFLQPVIYFGRAFPNWRVRVIPTIVISGFLAFVSKNPICFSDGSVSS